jgi:hypothetical protein
MTSPPELIARIQMEFLEMPGLKLTAEQARRLWGLPIDLCDTVLASLVEQGFLARTAAGSYVRRGGSPERIGAGPYGAALADFG